MPVLWLTPIEENQSAPLDIISGAYDKDLTLLMLLGFPQTPNAAGNGGLYLGIDLLPSTASIRAVSSPAT